MRRTILEANFRKDPLGYLIITMFIAVSVFLLTLSVNIGLNTFFSMDKIMETAMTPHFLQMHRGEPDLEKLKAFVSSRDEIEHFHIQEFINIPGTEFMYTGGDLSSSTQDNGLVVQPENFDFLLDDNNRKIAVSPGEIYIPLSYENIIRTGDTLTVRGVPFLVKGALRDSQMNSPLSSSKRFLVHPDDLKKVIDASTQVDREYLIEFLLKEGTDLGRFATSYTDAALPTNGPQLTYPLFRLLNSLSEGIRILMTLFSSILALIISLLILRLIINGRLSEDMQEIGTMKALGMDFRHITSIYRDQYLSLALIGAVLGFILAHLTKGFYMKGVMRSFGANDKGILIFLLTIIPCLLFLLIIRFFITRTLNRIRSLKPVRVLKGDYGSLGRKGVSKVAMGGGGLKGMSRFSLNSILTDLRAYLPIILLLILSVVMVAVPMNLSRTIRDKEFTRNLAIGAAQLSLDAGNYSGDREMVDSILKNISIDNDIARYTIIKAANLRIIDDTGVPRNLRTDGGDMTVFPINYLEGQAPGPTEIALSKIAAEDGGYKVGDTLTVDKDGQRISLKVSGIYSDITNGGKTGKVTVENLPEEIMAVTVFMDLKDSVSEMEFRKKYSVGTGTVRVRSISEFMDDTMKETLKAIDSGYLIAGTASLLVVFLIIALFFRMILIKERRQSGLMRALGFRASQLKADYIMRSGILVISSVILSFILTMTLGERLVSAVFSTLGTGNFTFGDVPVLSLLLMLAALTASSGAATMFSIRSIGRKNLDIRKVV